MNGLTSYLEWADTGMKLPISRCRSMEEHFIPFRFCVKILRLDSAPCTVLSQHVWWLKDCPSGAAPVRWPPPAANAGDQRGSPQPWPSDTSSRGWRYYQSMPWSRILPGILLENIATPSCLFLFCLCLGIYFFQTAMDDIATCVHNVDQGRRLYRQINEETKLDLWLKNHCRRVTTGKLGAMMTFEILRLAVTAPHC